MNENELTNTSFLTLVFSEIKIEFTCIDDVQEFAQSQRSFWAWLEQTAKKDNALNQVWSPFGIFFDQINQFVQQCRQHQENESQLSKLKNNLVNQANTAVSQGFRLDDTPEAQFVFDLKDKISGQVSAYALALLNGTQINFSSHLAQEGSFWAMQFKHGSTETIESYTQALDIVKRSWAARFGKQHKKLETQNHEITEELVTLRDQFNLLIAEVGEAKNLQLTDFQQLIEDSKSKLSDIEHTYDEKLSLQSSVQYWSDKKEHHHNVMWKLALGTIFLAICTGGGFVWAAYELLKETMSQVPLWKLGFMLAISSFGVWLTRLSSKIFISNLHLRTDADERITMIQTYLALLREGNGPKDEERQLILQTLFRPSSTGFINEDGPSGFYEAMLKVTGK